MSPDTAQSLSEQIIIFVNYRGTIILDHSFPSVPRMSEMASAGGCPPVRLSQDLISFPNSTPVSREL